MYFQNIVLQNTATLFYQVTKRKGTAFVLFPKMIAFLNIYLQIT